MRPQAISAQRLLPSTTSPGSKAASFNVGWDFTVDKLTMIMLMIVTGIGSLIHIYATGYMAHEEGYYRFFAYLNLFMFFMLNLVLAANYLILFVGWEGVGLCSYLLIGFYFVKKSATTAGNKAFIVNRIGDFGFSLAMFLIVVNFKTLDFNTVFSAAPGIPTGTLTTIALLLLVGACGKSAQIPLYVWLPDAMEGPTPVSALIHAATMVTAGVYMCTRSARDLHPRSGGNGNGRGDRSRDRGFRRDHRPRSRTTSRRFTLTRPSRSSGTCSSALASELSPPASGTW